MISVKNKYTKIEIKVINPNGSFSIEEFTNVSYYIIDGYLIVEEDADTQVITNKVFHLSKIKAFKTYNNKK